VLFDIGCSCPLKLSAVFRRNDVFRVHLIPMVLISFSMIRNTSFLGRLPAKCQTVCLACLLLTRIVIIFVMPLPPPVPESAESSRPSFFVGVSSDLLPLRISILLFFPSHGAFRPYSRCFRTAPPFQVLASHWVLFFFFNEVRLLPCLCLKQ